MPPSRRIRKRTTRAEEAAEQAAAEAAAATREESAVESKRWVFCFLCLFDKDVRDLCIMFASLMGRVFTLLSHCNVGLLFMRMHKHIYDGKCVLFD